MRSKILEFESMVSQLSKYKTRSGAYSEQFKILCAEMALTNGVAAVSNQSGICRSSIYKWMREFNIKKPAIQRDEAARQRPLVLQEINTSPTPILAELREITMITRAGVSVKIPADDKVVFLILDRMLEGSL